MPTLDNFSLGNYMLRDPDDKVKYATGTATVPGNARNFLRENGSNYSYRSIQVTGLPFRPKKVFLRTSITATRMGVIYDFNSRSAAPSSNGADYNLCHLNADDNYTVYLFRVFEYLDASTSTSNAWVAKDSFLLPITATVGETVIWEAYG
ncbi:hypothetical protein [Paenibacillus sp. 2KB_22]|uniref:hypothetical protein n=1 Tax=Paenibacillus sp. 2KB_22 TaxID=3232978 RepID=UPI003F9C6BB7